jgi:hypothetical protein
MRRSTALLSRPLCPNPYGPFDLDIELAVGSLVTDWRLMTRVLGLLPPVDKIFTVLLDAPHNPDAQP